MSQGLDIQRYEVAAEVIKVRSNRHLHASAGPFNFVSKRRTQSHVAYGSQVALFRTIAKRQFELPP